MGLITEEVEVGLNGKTIKYYEDIGYKIPRIKDDHYRMRVPIGTSIMVKIKDLQTFSAVYVDIECDGCQKILKNIQCSNYSTYVQKHSNNGKYYCKDCAMNLYGSKNKMKANLKKSKSFEQWCLDNNRQDILSRWDYSINSVLPSEITYATSIKYYFKCPLGKHKSELKDIVSFVNGHEGCMLCKLCNSLAIFYPEVFKIWSDKNSKTPYDYSHGSSQFVHWKCNDEKHEDYYRSISSSSNCNFRCPECQCSQGENKISYHLNNKYIYYIPQKEFDGLVGLGNGNLSYDFYLPNYNLLIEYQGEYHDGTARNQTEEEFIIQKEHDRRKREYAKENNIKLLEIWYWDFDNIESILEEYLNSGEVMSIA